MIARWRRVGVLEPNVPEYLVDNRLIGDKREKDSVPENIEIISALI
ncbi:MAG: hypothetical protein MIO92_02740 [Methanosarcinaceae archaeon]|nr:hypothetical protein [Methanosarcinaceae archaeon]